MKLFIFDIYLDSILYLMSNNVMFNLINTSGEISMSPLSRAVLAQVDIDRAVWQVFGSCRPKIVFYRRVLTDDSACTDSEAWTSFCDGTEEDCDEGEQLGGSSTTKDELASPQSEDISPKNGEDSSDGPPEKPQDSDTVLLKKDTPDRFEDTDQCCSEILESFKDDSEILGASVESEDVWTSLQENEDDCEKQNSPQKEQEPHGNSVTEEVIANLQDPVCQTMNSSEGAVDSLKSDSQKTLSKLGDEVLQSGSGESEVAAIGEQPHANIECSRVQDITATTTTTTTDSSEDSGSDNEQYEGSSKNDLQTTLKGVQIEVGAGGDTQMNTGDQR